MFEPMPGEPPLSLFRDTAEVELQVGTTVDRFGDADGNVLYAARIPFGQRSLPPDWVNRPYHLYRVERPVRALSGVAIPWFDQPGGGTAYVFARSVGDLVADGVLTEVRDVPPPPG
ncbi:MAG: TNT domain-containing protein [Actinomadura rubrobrunea]|nr:TNT domain-containing protein [Actinomadura rubrobrunea]